MIRKIKKDEKTITIIWLEEVYHYNPKTNTLKGKKIIFKHKKFVMIR